MLENGFWNNAAKVVGIVAGLALVNMYELPDWVLAVLIGSLAYLYLKDWLFKKDNSENTD